MQKFYPGQVQLRKADLFSITQTLTWRVDLPQVDQVKNIGSLIIPAQLTHRMEVLCQEEQTKKTRSFHPHVTSEKSGHDPQVWCRDTEEERVKRIIKMRFLQLLQREWRTPHFVKKKKNGEVGGILREGW